MAWTSKTKIKITRKNNDIYTKLSKHPIVKQSLDKYFEYLDKPKLNWNDWCDLLFEYCDEKQETPKNKTEYNGYNIGERFQNTKGKIKDTENDLYQN